MKKQAVAFAAVLFLSAALAPVFAFAKDYVIVMPGTVSVQGKSKSHMQEFSEEITNSISKVIGAPIKLDYTSLAEEDYLRYAISGLVSKKIDIAGFGSDWYAKLSPQMREKFPPLLALLVNNKKNMNYCFFVRKEDGIKNLEQLRGKTYESYVYRDARYLLYKGGIDEPLDKFFGKTIYKLSVTEEDMRDLVNNKVDTFVSWDFLVDSTRAVDPRYKNIQALGCREYGLNVFMIYRNDLDPAVISKLQNAMLNWKKDPRFSSVKFFLLAIKGGVFIPKPEDFDLSYAVDKLSVDRGWDNERKAFIKKGAK